MNMIFSKNLIRTSILAAAFAFLTACWNGGTGATGGVDANPSPLPTNPSEVTPIPGSAEAPPATSSEGGISGGGGGTLPATPASRYDIARALQLARGDLRIFLRGWENDKFSSSDLHKKMFGGTPNLLTVLESTDLEVADTKPCFDHEGLPVDGSIYASFPGTICISSFTIAPKLSPEQVRTEVLALVIHELSHLVGADEKEAVELQKRAVAQLQDLKDTAFETYANSRLETLNGAKARLLSIVNVFHKLRDPSLPIEVKQLAIKIDISNMVQWWDELFGRLGFSFDSTLDSSLFTAEESDFLKILQLKWRLWFTYIQSDATARFEPSEPSKYDLIYLDRVSLSAREAAKALGSSYQMDGNQFADRISFPKIQTFADFQAEVEYIFSTLTDYYIEKALDLTFAIYRPLREFPAPWLPHPEPAPWSHFAGTYEVHSESCHADLSQWAHVNKIQIFQESSGFYLEPPRWYLEATVPIGTPNLRVNLNLSNRFGGNAENSISFGGDSSAARVVHQYQHSWTRAGEGPTEEGFFWSQTTLTIQRTEDSSKFLLRIAKQGRKLLTIENESCELKLTKI